MSETVVLSTVNCEVVLDAWGFYARCTAPDCTWVTDHYHGRHQALMAARAHEDAS